MDDQIDNNPYMALRAAKIARNQARLRELGLYKPKAVKDPAFSTDRKRVPGIKRKSKHSITVSSMPLRRSVRISSLPNNPNYREKNDVKEQSAKNSDTKKRGTKPVPDIDEYTHILDSGDDATRLSPRPSTSSRQKSVNEPAANSVRSISLDISILLRKFLAKPMHVFGKYFVIEKSFYEAAYPEDLQRLCGVSRLSFNKFSGVQPWKNVIFLWINVGGPTSANSLINDFSHSGSQVSWFGGSKMREDSPVIQNLIRLGKESASTPSFSSGIILWCRQYDWGTKKLLPYVCLGRLAYESHISGSHPVAFTWRLVDYKEMTKDETKRNIFRGIAGPA